MTRSLWPGVISAAAALDLAPQRDLVRVVELQVLQVVAGDVVLVAQLLRERNVGGAPGGQGQRGDGDSEGERGAVHVGSITHHQGTPYSQRGGMLAAMDRRPGILALVLALGGCGDDGGQGGAGAAQPGGGGVGTGGEPGVGAGGQATGAGQVGGAGGEGGAGGSFEGVDPLLGAAAPELVQGGFAFTEGPVWLAALDVLRFSDIPANEMLELDGDVITVWRSDSGGTNGNGLTPNGDIVMCEGGARRVSLSPAAGAPAPVPVATQYQGNQLQLSERRHRPQRRHDLLHRSDVRARRRHPGDPVPRRLPRRPSRRGRAGRRQPRSAQRHRALARRERALRDRLAGRRSVRVRRRRRWLDRPPVSSSTPRPRTAWPSTTPATCTSPRQRAWRSTAPTAALGHDGRRRAPGELHLRRPRPQDAVHHRPHRAVPGRAQRARQALTRCTSAPRSTLAYR